MPEAELEHPDRGRLASFLHGTLREDERLRVEEHVAGCDSCCDVLRSIPDEPLVAQLQRADTPPDTPGETEMGAGGDRRSEAAAPRTEGPLPAELAGHPRYRIVKKLGSGGMGDVYQAEHRLMERPVALKVISGRLVDSDVAVERFRLEVKAAAKLAHRNIVAAHDAEQAGGLHFLVMEFIEGTDLRELVERRGKLSVLHACNYAMQAAQGLQHALEQGMVHRDVKPHNLMRTKAGVIKILDFGLARFASQQEESRGDDDGGLTGDGATLGTPDYIAPEQARDSRTADIRADIYSLGCTLYFLLAGRPPFPGGTVIEKVVAHCERAPTPLRELRDDIPQQAAAIVDKMMAKDPARRYQTPAELVEALRPLARPASASPPATDSSTAAAAPTPPPVQAGAELPELKRPADQLDLAEIPSAEFPALAGPPAKAAGSKSPAWRRTLRRHRKLLAGVAFALAAVVLVAGLWPSGNNGGDGVENGGVENGGGGIGNGGGGGAGLAEGGGGRQFGTDWIDLIAAVDPGRDTVAGSWRKGDGELYVGAMPNARLTLPYMPPPQYELEVTFSRLSGSDSIALLFTAGDGQAAFDIDAWGEHLAGIQNIDGRTLQEIPSRAGGVELINGRRYTAMVRVSSGQVEALLDGKLLMTYEGDGSNLQMLDLWQLPDPRSIGIGAYHSSTTFHRVRIRPLGE